MPRFAFKCQANFPTAASRNAAIAAAQTFVDAHPAIFPFPPTNTSIGWHGGLTLWLFRGDVLARQDLDTVFAAMKSQLISRGAIAPSELWLKVQADTGGVTDSTSTAAPDPLGGPDWTDHTPAIDNM